eukprot:scaffold12829_cov65-Attheya_sp.AAC.1
MAMARNAEAVTTVVTHHVAEDLRPSWLNPERTRVLTKHTTNLAQNDKKHEKACIIYWMQRDVRTVDNWALLFAQHLAQTCDVPLKVAYCLPPPPPAQTPANDSHGNTLPPKVWDMPMTERHGSFLLGGLEIVERELFEKGVTLEVSMPPDRNTVGSTLKAFAIDQKALAVVCDMNPIRHFRSFVEDQAAPLLDASNIPLYQVDAHNIVPVWHASPKREVGARTLRPKINKLLPQFMNHFASFEGNAHMANEIKLPPLSKKSWKAFRDYLNLDSSVPHIDWAQPGHEAAMKQFESFCSVGLKNFDTLRNDPNHATICSNLSPWINHGHVSFQRLALNVRALKKHANGTAAYIEEGVVRRELSDNYVYYMGEDYDELSGAAQWAQDSLELHTSDEREWLYTLDEFERALTHDDLWNAAQLQIVKEGKMHGFLRMYWCKKILEWSESPEVALRTGHYLNDRFALDGNDPNGFVGVGWSIMGIHDMGWKERPIFGKIRFMNYAGCKRKFKLAPFVARYPGAAENAIAAAKKRGKAPEGTVSKKKSTSSKGTTKKRKAPSK